MKPLREILSGLSHQKGLRRINLVQDDFLSSVSDTPGRKPLLNLCTLLALAVGSLVFVIYTGIFLIHDVILFRNDISISRSGAFMPKKACSCEQALYLFNTSELWADTGIQVHKGDRIKISASGAFQSSLTELTEAARYNRIPRYPWVGSNLRQVEEQRMFDTLLRKSVYTHMLDGQELCVDRNARFGAILYQIRTDADPCVSDWYETENRQIAIRCGDRAQGNAEISDSLTAATGTAASESELFARSEAAMGIFRLTRDKGQDFLPVDRDGTLYFAVNDIYLNDSLIRHYERKNIAALDSLTAADRKALDKLGPDDPVTDPELIGRLLDSAHFELSYLEKAHTDTHEDKLYFRGRTFRQHFRENRNAWYNDNLGQIAISVDIQRQIANQAVSHENWYRTLEAQLGKAIDQRRWEVWLKLLAEFFFVIPLVFLVTTSAAALGLYLILTILLFLCEYLVLFPITGSASLFRLTRNRYRKRRARKLQGNN